jgi:site-specific recombinase XerD
LASSGRAHDECFPWDVSFASLHDRPGYPSGLVDKRQCDNLRRLSRQHGAHPFAVPLTIESIHVAAYIEELSRARSAPTAKLRLAALRHLFDWMVTGQIMPTNSTAAVRGPLHVVRRGKTPVLDPAEARQLLDAIDATADGRHRLS